MVVLPKFGLILWVSILVGCTVPLSPSVPVVPQVAVSIEKPELERYFQGFEGAFVLYDQANHQTMRYNPQGCSVRYLPASTFKILNALIGLETGVIPDDNFVIPWDGTQYPLASWNQDQTLKSAFQNSVVWYYQELARRVGQEKMQEFVRAAEYGNQDISGPSDSFWLNGNLRISADEQVAFLSRFLRNELPFSSRSMQIVREMMRLDSNGDAHLSGKTGGVAMDTLQIGWFVGFLEVKDHPYLFATRISGASQQITGIKAKEITQKVLQSMDLLP